MLISRADKGLIADWWFTVDRIILGCVLMLMAAGVLFSMAASPPVAARIGLDHFHFFTRQLVYLFPAVVVLLAASMLTIQTARRLALLVFVGGLGAMVAAILWGPEIKGAHRWLDLGPLNVQPSEFVKPAFAVCVAWFLAEGTRRPDMPGLWVAFGLFSLFAGLLVLQPDFGQLVLVAAVFGTLLLVYGISWLWVFGLGGVGAAGAALAYFSFPHVASRVNRFLDPEAHDTFQVDMATQAFHNGGLMGTGPGGGSAKHILPDAHTDFIPAVIGEEFGFIACAVLIFIIGFIVLRVLRRALQASDPFVALALTGLVSLYGFQSFINLGVNLTLLPAKGMTLPFISYGGSSLIAMAFSMGLLLAFSRVRGRARAVQAATTPGLAMKAA
ncbi:MAG: putative peptidoglycan glycosyltransferase FtsW [Anderseniella sp.]|jgi:cell division protein FtsW|nr:putative peptidoglycan glycosyltransferase FtsW [Anderseniella sp.]